MTLPTADVTFEPEGHVYEMRGVRLPSVTQIMRPMTLMLYSDVPYSTLDEAADRGSRAHEQISNYVTYGILETDEDTEPYIEAFREFEESYKPVWIASEYRTYHKLMRYAGTIDLLGYIEPDDGTGIDVIDIKCTSEYHPVLLATQLGAYAEALNSHGIKTRKRYGLHLQRNGKPHFEEVADGYKNFLHCMAIVNAMAAEIRQ